VSITEVRFGQWLTTTNRDVDLVDLQDFVYEMNAGEGAFVYTLDRGINVKVKNVSPPNLASSLSAFLTDLAE
jgi:hypothetical protein